MGVIIWYKVEFLGIKSPHSILPLTISNDVYSGTFIVDADITLKMAAGVIVDTFEIKFTNLPDEVADLLKDKATAVPEKGLGEEFLAITESVTATEVKAKKEAKAKQNPLQVEIHLGYFDDFGWFRRSNPVMKGAVSAVRNKPNEDGLLVTTVKGKELTGYRLSINKKSYSKDTITVKELVAEIAQDAGVTVVSGTGPAAVYAPDITLDDFTLKTSNGMAALRKVAEIANVPLVVGDGKIFIGPAVGGSGQPVSFHKQINIVELGEEVSVDSNNKDESDSYLNLTVLGDPKLRAGQSAVVSKDPKVSLDPLLLQHLSLKTGTPDQYIIASVIHSFSTQSGYTCKLALVTAKDAQNVAKNFVGAYGLLRRFFDAAEKAEKPAIDIGEVKEYREKHLTTLNYGQELLPSEIAPSVKTKVNDNVLLINKPISSPFAWHKCGLIVPVYPGMRALLAHNLGLTNDAVVAGFLWPEENPAYDRPKNLPGDYWLCLPTELDENQQPAGKGVNDLTDQSGLRVIEARGLRILVGNDKLQDVGERPSVPEAQTIVIEHQSGTKISIGSNGALNIVVPQQETKTETSIQIGSDGALNIEVAKGKEMSMTNGSVTLKLTGETVSIS